MTEDTSSIRLGAAVALAFSMRNEGGEILEQWTEDDPLRYIHGSGTLVPGLEKALEGRAVGERFEVTIPPEEGFGPKREGGAKQLPRSALPHRGKIHRGMPFVMQGDDGKLAALWITAVSDDTVEVDRNHPLAGRTLTFDVTVLGVRSASGHEVAHGHAAEDVGDPPGHRES